jgi:hypothetical protein
VPKVPKKASAKMRSLAFHAKVALPQRLNPLPHTTLRNRWHIAIAAVHGMDFLVTWNCAHIANAAIAKSLALICREHACECPVICTPEELMGE